MYDYVFKNDKHIIHVLYSAQKCWKMLNSIEQHRTASNMCQAIDMWSMYTCNKYILLYDNVLKNQKYII